MSDSSYLNGRDVYIVDGVRTPFLKARDIGPFTASDLAVEAGRSLLNRQPVAPELLDEVIVGCAMPGPDEANIARIIALRLGCGYNVPAYTVMRNCASGMQALDSAAANIATGRSDLVLAGGTEAMSHAPVLYQARMASWLGRMMSQKTLMGRLGTLMQFRPSFLAPVIGLLRGLQDPVVGLNMGQTAEQLAYKFGITREAMDAFASRSHQRADAAYKSGNMEEVVPIIDKKGKLYSHDDGIRLDSTVEKLGRLKPVFDKKYGMVTAGNSSQITDGACMLLLASAHAVKKYRLPILGRIVDAEWSALNPSEMGLGPVHAAGHIMARHHLKSHDFDTWEINEAFAAQVLACLAAFDDKAYCKEHLGLTSALGAPSIDNLNSDGGAIALGHPIGASGARIVLHVLESLKFHSKNRGMAAICIGGGQGGAMYLTREEKVREK